MLDGKVNTLLTLVSAGSYTKAAQMLSLTQPAVSHQMRLLEEEYGIRLFYSGRKSLKLTPEGETLVKYAQRLVALDNKARHAIDDARRNIRRFTVGITTTLGEYLVSQIFSNYCSEHPEVSINIVTDTINNIYDMLSLGQADLAIVEGGYSRDKYSSVLLDTDYLCLVVGPDHPLAHRRSVALQELKKERFILRSPNAGTRTLFESHLRRHNEDISAFNIIIETDNITTIKELVASGLGVTIMAHSACREEAAAGRLVLVPIENMNMPREINMVYHQDFSHPEVLAEILRIYRDTQRQPTAARR